MNERMIALCNTEVGKETPDDIMRQCPFPACIMHGHEKQHNNQTPKCAHSLGANRLP